MDFYGDNLNFVDNSNNKIKISGSIGMVKLVKDLLSVFIFFDDHSNTKYCKNEDSIFLYDLFDKTIRTDSNCVILLEEPFINNYSNIEFLWNKVPHIIKFRNFYKRIIKKCSDTHKACNVFPIDIRLILSDISIDILIDNIDNEKYFDDYKISTLEYFKNLLYLFDYVDYNHEWFKNSDNNINFIKKIFNKYIKDVYYVKLKEHFNYIYKQFIQPNKFIEIKLFLNKYKYISETTDFECGYPFKNNKNKNIFLSQYDKLINGIMEFYTYILLSKMKYKNIIIYSGYYHSNNLKYILEKYYNFINIYDTGITKNIENINEKDINNCLLIDKDLLKL